MDGRGEKNIGSKYLPVLGSSLQVPPLKRNGEKKKEVTNVML